MIQALGVGRKYGSFHAIKDVSFTIAKGEVVGLLGQNGAGKSTLMNVLSGCLAPSSGHASISGYDIADQPMMAKRNLGYLPEIPPLYPELTVRESLNFCCRLMAVHTADINKHLLEIMELTDTFAVQDMLCSSLSRGYRQRVGLAQALCGDPDILLLDEPTAGFDPAQAKVFRRLIKRLSAHKAILLSTHLMAEVQAMCSRVLILHQGSVMKDHRLGEAQPVLRYQLVVSGADAALPNQLRQISGISRVKVLSGQGKSPMKLIIDTAANSNFQQALQGLLGKQALTLLELTPLGDSLEQLFLQTIGMEDLGT